ncbi:MAG: hypothetical protein EP332_06285 [Bacteroidetes bacterium]|nr:MAG: hypothetical protein EP332_06285 [Bacteroidota bacterium]
MNTVTTSNYFEHFKKLDISKLPEPLRIGHEVVDEATNHGKNWNTGDKDIDELIELQISKFGSWYANNAKPAKPTKPAKSAKTAKPARPAKTAKPKRKVADKRKWIVNDDGDESVMTSEKLVDFISTTLHYEIQDNDVSDEYTSETIDELVKEINSGDWEINIKEQKRTAAAPSKKPVAKRQVKKAPLKAVKFVAKPETQVKKYSKELQIIRSFISARNKDLTATSLERRLKAISQLPNNHSHKDLIGRIKQGYNAAMKVITDKKVNSIVASISDSFIAELKSAIDSASVKIRVDYLAGTKISNAPVKKKVATKPAKAKEKSKPTPDSKKFLRGPASASDVIGAHYPSIDIGPYKKVFGNVAANFDIMVHGEPGAGKTFYLLKFADYLADHHGKTLYLSKEEYGARTLKDKLVSTGVDSDNLTFYSSLRGIDLNEYDFLFFDSITALKLNLDDYIGIREKYPHLGCVLILQETKEGTFRGGKDWEHEVEIAARFTVETDQETGKTVRAMEVYKNRYQDPAKYYL